MEFNDIYFQNKRYVKSLVNNLVLNPDDRQEVFQDVFMKLHKYPHQANSSNASIKTWLYTLTMSVYVNYYREYKRKNQISFVSLDNLNSNFLENILENENSDRPDYLLLEKERELLIRNAIDRLPKHQRQALILFYFENLTYKQIADALNVELGTIKSNIFCAKRSLRQILNGSYRAGLI